MTADDRTEHDLERFRNALGEALQFWGHELLDDPGTEELAETARVSGRFMARQVGGRMSRASILLAGAAAHLDAVSELRNALPDVRRWHMSAALRAVTAARSLLAGPARA